MPRARDAEPELRARLSGRSVAVFLDYDGTLTPIVLRPEDAALDPRMRETLHALARTRPVTIVSGRSLEDLRARVDLPGVSYAGCHGLEIETPTRRLEHPIAEAARPQLREAEVLLDRTVGRLPGVQLEPKGLALAVHFRRASDEDGEAVVDAVRRAARDFDRLRYSGGKKIAELRPDTEWDKGRALRWVLEVEASGALPVFVGDDLTDEDAFRAIGDDGVAILVGDHGGPTLADYRIEGAEEMGWLLRLLAETHASVSDGTPDSTPPSRPG